MKPALLISIVLLPVYFLLPACSNKVPVTVTEDVHADSLIYLAAIEQQEQANKKLVTDYYQELYGDKNTDAIDRYLDSNYVQHNPNIADGRDALRAAAIIWFKAAVKEKIDIKHIAADGNFVYLHTRGIENGKTVAIMDIYRVENGKIMEHWDVTQAMPERSLSKHPFF